MSDPQKPKLKAVPDPEVSDRPRRRTFTAEYKLSVLGELDGCTEPGEVGAVLRREGLYSSHITHSCRNRISRVKRDISATPSVNEMRQL